MGLLENLAAAAIRAKVIATLRENCPAGLEAQLEELLANKEAVHAIQGFVASCLSRPAGVTPQAILDLPFAENIKDLLTRRPDLVQYLVQTARSRLQRPAL